MSPKKHAVLGREARRVARRLECNRTMLRAPKGRFEGNEGLGRASRSCGEAGGNALAEHEPGRRKEEVKQIS
jgi:hypothetical protein